MSLLMHQAARYSDTIFFKAIFVRLLLVYVSFAIGATFFSNWRVFPSVDFSVIPENWAKFIFYSIWIGLPYLFVSQTTAVILQKTFKLNWTFLSDVIFVVLFLIGPFSIVLNFLLSYPGSTFSFGVSEGEIIRDGVVTELGKKYYFMHRMMEALHMVIYLLLRFLLSTFWPPNFLQKRANS
jgi:hypothetical protein